MRLFILLLLLFHFLGAHAQDSSGMLQEDIAAQEQKSYEARAESMHRALRTAASDNFDVTYYRCEWKVDPAIRYISGAVTVYFTMKTPASSITLDLANELTVNSVSHDGMALAFTHSAQALQIDFPGTLPAGSTDSVRIVYEGIPPAAGLGSFVTAQHGAAPSPMPVLWTLSEPFGSRDWWPCKNDLDDKADSVDVFITHPAAYKAVSNGMLRSELPAGGGELITHWQHRYPIASYLVCMAVTNYRITASLVDVGGMSVPVQTFYYPESEPAFTAGVQDALDAMTFYGGLIGDYPFKNEKYGHVQFGWNGGMEHQTCSFMNNMSEGLVTHELAHQWFGNKVTCRSWEDVWLHEGFATYMASIYHENKYPADAAANRQARVNQITALPGGSVRVDDVTSTSRIFSNRLSYFKGSYLLYMLRWILGDNAFYNGLTQYLNDPALAYGYAATSDLQAHLELASGRDLDYFFDQWFNGQGYPSYQVEWYPAGNAVEIRLSQTTSHPSVGFFRLPVPLLFRNTVSGEQKLVVLDHTASGQLFKQVLGFVADEVVFDPEVWLLSANNTVTKMSESLPLVFSSFEVQCLNGNAHLTWKTENKANTGIFEVQVSNDGLAWTSLAALEAAGSGQQFYTYDDARAGDGDRYYRVKETDKDGKVYHSRMHAGCVPRVSAISVFPNPVKNTLFVKGLPKGQGNFRMRILDGKGVMQRAQEVIWKDQVEIKTDGLKPGIYLLHLTGSHGEDAGTFRFAKE
ncbi:M1 family aminopeptidase [Dyadobacter sandarakinus]|uniref:Aminopeptidase N n=1 Tax=Dyadobacter sandarakinus TaxID=2747268 RepID=A0ABX7I4E6_9BACT|nr:M1 family aminopeptidase [Dyadobacter sandarakinus]QRR00979.1 peptidase M1 [Dyadobacter sandarakinus]